MHLHQMAAQRVLAALPPGGISVLITDPPYTTLDRHSGSGHLRRWFRGGLSWPEIGRILATARRRMRTDGVAFVMTNGDGLEEALTAMRRAGFARVRPVTWDRRYPGLGGGLRHQTEFVLVGYLPGSRTLSGVDLVAVPAVGPGTTGRYPTEKPEGLGRKLAAMASVGRGDVVLDPFCGSGALLVGAKERGATVIGADIAAAAIQRARAKLGARSERTPGTVPTRPGRRPLLAVRRG
ncbi:MAG: DNA methyltransferase [Candidatus Limnocylindrales bacterium]